MDSRYTEAFAVFGLTPEAEESVTSKAYKKLALIHHPDRNLGQYHESTQMFQQIGAAWETCQEYYSRKNRPSEFVNSSWNRDDDVPLDPEEAAAFFQFLFEQIFLGRYSRAKTRQYRRARTGEAGANVFMFDETLADKQQRQQEHRTHQKNQHAEYLKRVREFELECEAEEAERKRQAKEVARQATRLAIAQTEAYQAIRMGNLSSIRQLFSQFNLNPNNPSSKKKMREGKYDTMLHAAAQSSHTDATMVQFLLEKGIEDLTAFHLAVRSGNLAASQVLLAHRDVHPSRAAKNGETPLQLAIMSRDLSILRLVIKDATVHDVQRCWDAADISDEMREVLRSKRGFVDPANAEVKLVKLSKSVQRQLTDERTRSEKMARLAEEERRAEVNRQKKLVKAEKRRIREAEEEEIRNKKAEQAALKRQQQENEESERRAEQERIRVAEELRRKEMEEKRRADEIAVNERMKEVKQKLAEERRQKQMAERRQERQRAQEQRRRDAEQRRLAEEEAQIQRMQEIERQHAEHQIQSESEEQRERKFLKPRRRPRKESDSKRSVEQKDRVRKRHTEDQSIDGDILVLAQDVQSNVAMPQELTDVRSRKPRVSIQRPFKEREVPQGLTGEEKIRWELKETQRAEQSARDRARAAKIKLAKLWQPHDSQPPHIQEDIQTAPMVDDLFDSPRMRRHARVTATLDVSGTESPESPALAQRETSSFRGYRDHGRGRGIRGRGGRGRRRGHYQSAERIAP
ncbi:hypothetical protein F5876DRAFT_82142 [Lentinula aff. lateritia]|uniref:Uncharacterized protein n=1 Tax=Lentinula aff. lateritia TaxID=2804960 RepID=A0ACC1TKJ8_9AGAR|nr:hypothetical protein F5876DRAFT_82142 [Lentinula aff. lateritia]